MVPMGTPSPTRRFCSRSCLVGVGRARPVFRPVSVDSFTPNATHQNISCSAMPGTRHGFELLAANDYLLFLFMLLPVVSG
jgi:hypothetical protein